MNKLGKNHKIKQLLYRETAEKWKFGFKWSRFMRLQQMQSLRRGHE